MRREDRRKQADTLYVISTWLNCLGEVVVPGGFAGIQTVPTCHGA